MRAYLLALVACSVTLLSNKAAFAQNPASDPAEDTTSRHDSADPFLDIKIEKDKFSDALWGIGLSYDCDRTRQRAQRANFNRQFSRRIKAVGDLLAGFGSDVQQHGHDVLAIGRCLNPPKGGASLPASAKQFAQTLKNFEKFLANRKRP